MISSLATHFHQKLSKISWKQDQQFTVLDFYRRLQFHTVLVYRICTVDDKLYNCIVHFILDNLNNSIAVGKESSKFFKYKMVTLGF